MNDWEKQKLREHWQKPGNLKALLQVLPMVPHNERAGYKRVVYMTGISFDPAEMAQVYYMLEEDGILVRDGAQPGPAEHRECTHSESNNPCQGCRYEIHQRGTRAAVRYCLVKELDEY
jgi:hypothetical protein